MDIDFELSGVYSVLDSQGWIDECNRRFSWLNKTNLEDQNKWLKESNISYSAELVDIGCGIGLRSIAYAQYLQYGNVKGFDINELVLNKAREFAKQKKITNVSFDKMEQNKVPLSDSSVDCVCFDSVLWAVANPILSLTEASRLIKPRGLLMVKNFDCGGFLMSYPQLPSSLINLFHSFDLATQDWGGDIFIGRKLSSYITQVGLTIKQISIEPEVKVGVASETEIENFWKFFSQWKLPLVNGGYITINEYDNARKDFQKWSKQSSRMQIRTTIRVLAEKQE